MVELVPLVLRGGEGPHPVDRMAGLKDQIAALEREYDQLRRQVINGEVDCEGADWVATVGRRSKRGIRLRDAERLLPQEMLDLLVRTSTFDLVLLTRRGANRPKAGRQARKPAPDGSEPA